MSVEVQIGGYGPPEVGSVLGLVQRASGHKSASRYGKSVSGDERDTAECRTSGQLARAELGAGMGHLWLAATHGAESVGSQVRPRLDTVRTVTLVPLAAAVRAGTAEAGKVGRKAGAKAPRTRGSKMASKRTKLLAGLLIAGAAAGVTGALVARRRSRSGWEEYEAAGRATVHTGTGTGLSAGATDRDQEWDVTGKQTVHDWAAATKDTATKDTVSGDGVRPEQAKTEAAKAKQQAERLSDPLDLTAKQFADNTTPSSATKNSRGVAG